MKEIMFQLRCVKEHLAYISKTTDRSVDFDIEVLDGCISRLEDMSGYGSIKNVVNRNTAVLRTMFGDPIEGGD